MARLCTGLSKTYLDILAPYSNPISTLAAGTHRFDPLVPLVAPNFQMLGSDDAVVDILSEAADDVGFPSVVLVFIDGSFGFFSDALHAYSVGGSSLDAESICL